MNQEGLIRVLIAKPGLDGHDKGAKVVAKALKDAGMEVIYLGMRQNNDSILRTAVQESVDIIGLSILSGSHIPICKELLEEMVEQGIHGIKVVVGGSIPKTDVQTLKELGVSGVFRSSNTFDEIANGIRNLVKAEDPAQIM